MNGEIKYQLENILNFQEFKYLLNDSTLGKRRPVDDDDRLKKMCQHANLIISARESSGQLIGIARALSDFSFCTYLSDLAVHVDYQKQGIGKQLINQIILNAPDTMLILLAAPKAIKYYPKIGMEHFEHAFIYKNE